MRRSPITAWFRPKRFGYGWTPATPEGWAVPALASLAISIIAGLLNGLALDLRHRPRQSGAPFASQGPLP